jgi:hypothetical protein
MDSALQIVHHQVWRDPAKEGKHPLLNADEG